MGVKSFEDCRLYTFVDTAYLVGRDPAIVAKQLCDGGADVIQLRAKDHAAEAIRRMAETILPITRSAGVPLVINDHPEIAAEIGAEACHLGQEDFFDCGNAQSEDRSRHLAAVKLGLSTHAPVQAMRAFAVSPAYIAVGPIYPTATKPGARAVTLDYVRWAAAHVRIPWFAIGGISLSTLEDVLAAGARRICVVSAILKAPDVAQACQFFRERLASASRHKP